MHTWVYLFLYFLLFQGKQFAGLRAGDAARPPAACNDSPSPVESLRSGGAPESPTHTAVCLTAVNSNTTHELRWSAASALDPDTAERGATAPSIPPCRDAHVDIMISACFDCAAAALLIRSHLSAQLGCSRSLTGSSCRRLPMV